MTPTVIVERVEGADPNLPLPSYESAGAAGADLRADLMGEPPLTLASGARSLVQTGLRVAVPDGWEMQVRPRSGLALKHGITLANAVGTIDADYRGPLGVILLNLGDAPFEVTHGMRIAQAVLAPAPQGIWREGALDTTGRGVHGFGSTGA
ncbi:dUTP diphosphatase [Jannaschia aquimarina]|uniref:Deoxyuridine 5'-triphosphate nucleotidohydrolase n=1 Tax=Jannaschia aquimarina TaxID=935700 RepID=A0A0D1CIN9_9RHOB|nr:dUTP diphosphatase [Jannaschia aquimarina]KIT14602.1 Deoxyuridine 5'-triphosphate nucleotidohydrolase [Jannaschia aquimarina]SNS77250.1 dUTP pyrophosphatase [Jannaschia aquimarina]